MNLQELKDIINQYKNKFLLNSKTPWQFNKNQLLFKEINNKYNNLFKSTMEIIYLIKNYDNLANIHIFCYCGNKNNFCGINTGYSKYCSNKCKNNNIEHNNKIKQNKLNNIDENGLNSYQRMIIKGKQTKKLKYNDENYNNRNKAKQTCLNKYDVDNPWKSKNIRQKIENTMLIKYGVKHNWSSKDSQLNGRKTRQLLYGNENYTNRQKAKLTWLKIYGVDSYRKSQQFKNLFKNKEWLSKNIQKIYNTKKKNNSFNKSIQEDQVYNYLLQKFNKDDIERQYKSELYPFYCDFYIKSLNLYIEYHGTWTHHNKPFKNSIEDLEEVEKLKKKSQEINFKGKRKLFYLSVLNVWTKLDPLKLQTFKKNKLNYKIFYNIEQFLNWYRKLFI